MKLGPVTAIGVAALAVLLAIALGPACGIDPRSGDYRCGNGQGQCEPGRDCVDGWCVVDPDVLDGGGDCPAACTRCDNGTCFIECDGPGECRDRVVCPATMACDVRCAFTGSCGDGVACGGGRCTVTCSGTGSCRGDIGCGDACACTTSCAGTGACSGTITCPGPGACTQGGQCTDQPNPCDRC